MKKLLRRAKFLIEGMGGIAKGWFTIMNAFAPPVPESRIKTREERGRDALKAFLRDAESIRGDWEKVGNDIRRAGNIIDHNQSTGGEMLTIKPKDETMEPGNFNAEIRGNTVYFPRKLFRVYMALFAAGDLENFGDFICVLRNSEKSFAGLLNWSADDVKKARKKFFKQLRGHVDDATLDRARRTQQSTPSICRKQ